MEPIIDREVLYQMLSKDFGLRIPKDKVGSLLQDVFERLSTTGGGVVAYEAEYLLKLRQLSAIFSKRTDGDYDETLLIENAISQLHDTNLSMAWMNKFRPWRGAAWFQAAKHWVHTALPPLDHCLERVGTSCHFGPGSTFDGRGPRGRHILTKIGGTQTITEKSIDIVEVFTREHFPHWRLLLDELPTRVVPGNRVDFVPKDVSKVRQIAVEPSLNMFVQLGINDFLTHILKRRGINLTDQTLNQRLAQKGSIDGSLCTIDLSDASNRIAYGLVEDLLPSDWFEFLNALRSDRGILPSGEEIIYEFFSTQGNGFTFPLETIIFAAIASSVSSSRVTVYGDDIIAASMDYHKIEKAFDSCGFSINKAKSYHSGNFRESCGSDWISGFSVRPIFYKDPAVHKSEVASLHNLLLWRFGDEIPQTLAYLKSVVGEPILGPPQIWTSEKSAAMMYNKRSAHWNSWFWVLDGEHIPSKRYVTIPIKLKKLKSTNVAKYLTFLYGGSRLIQSSPLMRHREARFKLLRERCIYSVPPTLSKSQLD